MVNKYLAELSKEQLLERIELYAKNWLAHDGVWFQSIEGKFGMVPIGGTAVKSTAEAQHVEVKGLSADTIVAFKLSGENKAIALTNL